MSREELLNNPLVCQFLDELLRYMKEDQESKDTMLTPLIKEWELWRDWQILVLNAAGFVQDKVYKERFIRHIAQVNLTVEWFITPEMYMTEFESDPKDVKELMYGMSASKYPCLTGADELDWYSSAEEAIQAIKDAGLY